MSYICIIITKYTTKNKFPFSFAQKSTSKGLKLTYFHYCVRIIYCPINKYLCNVLFSKPPIRKIPQSLSLFCQSIVFIWNGCVSSICSPLAFVFCIIYSTNSIHDMWNGGWLTWPSLCVISEPLKMRVVILVP